ncbi:MAG: class I SAM-dependent methyltransferase [Cyclobacteriaceae bacterium]|nr:class I SAM-dependent methyltransferase [Cyclobacteriaceae bacterium]MCB0498688.1 class I SAM-dependent methyltransferase [Cyclobacteriaceae bacterium]MCB9237800.1 class I SAM-dependent methyltransferase [Flammeovirgaceae bacterium]MCO5270097.1 class I SAM-dependent methyltransferase [Cyclobacteriaceae bacterium]MCW5903163.1 class I SAM-dependent methyltransferase [Cyclobacteriaceae bacterium]
MANPHFHQILSEGVQRFIIDHENEDERAFVLKHKEILGLPSAEIARQIVGRKKAKTKLPLYYNGQNIIYPHRLNLEQCSSEKTARFKAGLVKGVLAADLTGGFGIDSYFLSKNFDKVVYVEPDGDLLETAKHNHLALGASNLEHHHADAAGFLSGNTAHFNLLYLDPSRRSNADRKVFKFSDCAPDVVSLLPTLFKKSNSILVKASPLIDIQQGLNELGLVSKVFVIGFDNECKEVLFLIANSEREPIIEVVDLSDGDEKPKPFSFTHTEENHSAVSLGEPSSLLYEPSAMMLKAGAFKLLANRFDLKKVAPNTHLYTAGSLMPGFPGRIFKIEGFLKPDSKSVHGALPEGQANIISRNYPLSPAQLKKRLKLKDGGGQFVIAFSGKAKKYLVLASRVK